ncbi:GntR family transcriptional regulator [soil metagenome]
MAKKAGEIAPGERLRDQVYRRMREELQSGALEPGRRLVETQLAELYGVSRTPIREVLLQLSREGVLTQQDRGFLVPVDTQKDILDRLEVRHLLDARLARHVATEATPEEIRALAKAHERQQRAHAAGKAKAFVDANAEFRTLLRAMCRNALLRRCAGMVDNVFQTMRGRIHESPENRALTLVCDGQILKALQDRDPDAAEAAVTGFIDRLLTYFTAERGPTDA